MNISIFYICPIRIMVLESQLESINSLCNACQSAAHKSYVTPQYIELFSVRRWHFHFIHCFLYMIEAGEQFRP